VVFPVPPLRLETAMVVDHGVKTVPWQAIASTAMGPPSYGAVGSAGFHDVVLHLLIKPFLQGTVKMPSAVPRSS